MCISGSLASPTPPAMAVADETSELTHGKLIYVTYTSKLTHGARSISHVGKLINSW